MKKIMLFLITFCMLVYTLEVKGEEAELIIPPKDVMNYLNHLNESALDIKTSEDFDEYEVLSENITAGLEWFLGNCAGEREKNPVCISEEAGILRDIHSYVDLSHDFVEQMISSLKLPADLRYSLLKSARFRVVHKKTETDKTAPSVQKLFGSAGGSHTLTVLTGLSEVFTPLPDHGPKLERALAERVIELESNYAFLKGVKRHLTNLAQLKYARLSVEAVENRINSMIEPLSFLKGSFSGEINLLGEGGKKPAAVVILEQLKQRKE